MNAFDLKNLTDWLIDGARSAPSPPRMMTETCERLVAAGLPLWRVGVFVRTLHPDIVGRNFIWRRGAEVAVGSANYEMVDSPEFLNNPLAIVFGEGREVRALLDGPDSKRFPLFDDLRAEGVTDYIALPILHIDGSVHASSWTTRQPGGFTDEQLNALRSLIPPLARVIEITRLRFTASTLLDTYVGNRAGETGCWRCFRSMNMSAISKLSARRYWKRRANPAPASKKCGTRSEKPSSASASASHCMSEEFCTAISGAATG